MRNGSKTKAFIFLFSVFTLLSRLISICVQELKNRTFWFPHHALSRCLQMIMLQLADQSTFNTQEMIPKRQKHLLISPSLFFYLFFFKSHRFPCFTSTNILLIFSFTKSCLCLHFLSPCPKWSHVQHFSMLGHAGTMLGKGVKLRRSVTRLVYIHLLEGFRGWSRRQLS